MANTVQVRTTVDLSALTRLRRDLPGLADDAVKTVALALEAAAKLRAPVDTGLLRTSIQATRVGPAHWRVVVGADYGLFVEYGTRWSRAQPYWNPAVQTAQGMFQDALADALRRGAR